MEKLLKKVIYRMQNFTNDNIVSESCPISIIDMSKWEWAQGVGLYGLVKYYIESKDKDTLSFLVNWFDNNIENGLPSRNVNTTCPLLSLAYLYEFTDDKKYLKICDDWAKWLMYEMPRTKENGFPHLVSGYEHITWDLWDDTLYMTVLFLAKMGRILNKNEYIEESVRQFLIHIKYLVDKQTGLFFHGFSFKQNNNFSGALWARGNCWYTAGIVDYLELICDYNSGVKDYFIDTLISQVEKLKELQHESGMWHTLLNDSDTYVETSATAGFVYGILKAVRLGFIDVSYKEVGIKGLKAVIRQIGKDGTVLGVSYGTAVSNDLDYYRNIEICPMMYGQALSVLALEEGRKLDGF